MNKKDIYSLILRYGLLVVLAVPNLFLFYAIFTPLTVYPVAAVLKLLYDAVLLEGNVLFLKGYYANIIPACVAGAAYYLLLILNLSTPMSKLKRLFSILFLFSAFLFINVTRIIVFAIIFTKGYRYFDVTHTLTWYIGSTLMVAVVWFVNIWIFEIKKIPVYTDIKNIWANIKLNTHPSKK